VEQFIPLTQEDIFKKVITKKRELVASGETQWTSEAPGDFGITTLQLVSYLLSESEASFDSRLKQTALPNALSVEAVIDGARNLGYRAKTPVSAVVPIEAKSTDTTFIKGNSKIKVPSAKGYTYLEVLHDVAFTGAEVKKFFAVEGTARQQEEYSDGTRQQVFYIPFSNIDSNTITMYVEDTGFYLPVSNYINSTEVSAHFMVEYDYSNKPIIILGDGVKGLIPQEGKKITFGFRESKGSLGNVAQGFVELLEPVANIDYIKTKLPAESTTAKIVTTTSSTIELEDDESIDLYPLQGVAYIGEEFEEFAYTSISGNSFMGITGITHDYPVGTSVRFTNKPIMGKDAESLSSIKESAQFYNVLKTSCTSTSEFTRITQDIKGVKRASAYNIAHNTLVQVIPSYGGYPTPELLAFVQGTLEGVSNVRDNVTVINPKYALVDITVRLDVLPNQPWSEVVKPLAESLIQAFLNPTATKSNGQYYYTSWGKTLTKGELTYLLFNYLGGRYIGNLYIDTFCRHGYTGSEDISLAYDEISNIGIINVINNTTTLQIGV